MISILSWTAAALVVAASPPPATQGLQVDGEAGRNSFSAVFEAKLGERINAVSSAVGCDLTYSPAVSSVSGACKVPLKSIKVDSDDTKTEHFEQWATNKKVAVEQCTFEARLQDFKLAGPLEAMKPVAFEGTLPFTVCGRPRSDGKPEKVSGSAVLMPAGEGRKVSLVRIRAKVEGFNRDAYRIGPKYTDGWLGRVQQLAPVVSEVGTIELSLFATVVQPAGQR